MKQILLMIAVVALVGCGTTKPTPPKATPPKATPPKAFTNTLGMKFVPVPGTKVQFCIWETRVKDYAAYAAANAGVDGGWKNFGRGGFKQADTHPVVNVNWNDANAFCAWLTKKEMAEGKIKAGQKYRLPTDAEWSVAVGLGKEKGNTPEEKQIGIKGVYPWGNQWPPPKEAGNYYKFQKVDKFDYTSPVGSFASNKLGLHDMGGNVWEWCEDKYRPTSSARVLRGASWGGSGPDTLLSSRRYVYSTDSRYRSFGFRCVLVGCGTTKPTPPKPTPPNAFVNSLGMPFVPVPGAKVQFCIWETRVKDYAAYAAAKAGVDGSWKDFDRGYRGFKQPDTHPVVNVSWNEAQAFCEWLTKKELAEGKIKAGQKYRLPTDAEWSVAVGLGKEKGNTPEEKQSGIKDVYPWGKGYPPPKEAGNYHQRMKVDKFEYTSPVGSFAANQHGLYDLGGNVWEWCEDKYSPTSASRVLRGASWGYGPPGDLLSSARRGGAPGGRYGSFGFRCVLVGGSGG